MAPQVIFLVFLFQCVFIPPAWTAENWAFAKEVDEITLYTRKTKGTPIKEMKASMVIAASLGEITKLIMDVEVTHKYKADPGGKLPEWALNMFVLEGPISTFKNMRKMLEMRDYQNVSLDTFLE